MNTDPGKMSCPEFQDQLGELIQQGLKSKSILMRRHANYAVHSFATCIASPKMRDTVALVLKRSNPRNRMTAMR